MSAEIDRQTRMFEQMVRIRQVEERLATFVEQGKIKTPCHLYIGQEAIAAGVCEALERADYVWGGHRSHGHYLAKGGDLTAMIGEIFGRAGGCSKGRGGSMHLFAADVGILGTVPIVAATIPLAVGTALASSIRRDGRVSVSFFGDGAVEEGHFHESVNFAALRKLPIIFVCENNFYASHLPLGDRRVADNLIELGRVHGAAVETVDGNDAEAVWAASARAAGRARAGEGPTFLECRTYRWRGHVGPSWDEDVGVKRSGELKDWLPRDPIQKTRTQLLTLGTPASALDAIEAAVTREVDAAFTTALAMPHPDPESFRDHVFVERT